MKSLHIATVTRRHAFGTVASALEALVRSVGLEPETLRMGESIGLEPETITLQLTVARRDLSDIDPALVTRLETMLGRRVRLEPSD